MHSFFGSGRCDGDDDKPCTQTHPELSDSSYIVDEEHFDYAFSAFLSDKVGHNAVSG